MQVLKNEELKQVRGGGISVWGGVTIAIVLVFLAGVIDGIVHPKACTD